VKRDETKKTRLDVIGHMALRTRTGFLPAVRLTKMEIPEPDASFSFINDLNFLYKMVCMPPSPPVRLYAFVVCTGTTSLYLIYFNLPLLSNFQGNLIGFARSGLNYVVDRMPCFSEMSAKFRARCTAMYSRRQ
jgi:hypothetical protein